MKLEVERWCKIHLLSPLSNPVIAMLELFDTSYNSGCLIKEHLHCSLIFMYLFIFAWEPTQERLKRLQALYFILKEDNLIESHGENVF